MNGQILKYVGAAITRRVRDLETVHIENDTSLTQEQKLQIYQDRIAANQKKDLKDALGVFTMAGICLAALLLFGHFIGAI